MVRRIQFGLHEMREAPAHEKKLAKTLSHWSNRLPKLVIVTRIGVQTDDAILNVHQPKAVIFHEYQGGDWRETIMEEDRFRRVYKFVTKKIMTYVEKREEAYIGNVVVKKTTKRRK